MNKIRNLNVARERARQRRTVGVAVDFDPSRLQLARRLAGMPRTHLARRLGVTAAAVTQFERGQARPTLPVIARTSSNAMPAAGCGGPIGTGRYALPSPAMFRYLRIETNIGDTGTHSEREEGRWRYRAAGRPFPALTGRGLRPLTRSCQACR